MKAAIPRQPLSAGLDDLNLRSGARRSTVDLLGNEHQDSKPAAQRWHSDSFSVTFAFPLRSQAIQKDLSWKMYYFMSTLVVEDLLKLKICES